MERQIQTLPADISSAHERGLSALGIRFDAFDREEPGAQEIDILFWPDISPPPIILTQEYRSPPMQPDNSPGGVQ